MLLGPDCFDERFQGENLVSPVGHNRNEHPVCERRIGREIVVLAGRFEVRHLSGLSSEAEPVGPLLAREPGGLCGVVGIVAPALDDTPGPFGTLAWCPTEWERVPALFSAEPDTVSNGTVVR